MKYEMDNRVLSCTPGWPQETGYPRCEISKGSEVTAAAPDYFVYCCPPAPVEMRDVSGINKRSNYRNNVPRPRGVHSYYNVMWDPRVRRGDVRNQNAKREEEECEKIRRFLCKPRKGQTFAEIKAQKRERRKTDVENLHQETVRFSQLEIANLIPKDPEKYLIDLSDEIDIADPCYKGRRLQTLRTFPIAPSRHLNIEDAATQVFPGEFFDFDSEAQPVIEGLLGAVLEQARLELLEEEELAALRLQRDLYEQHRKDALNRIQRLIQRERLLELERKRLAEGERGISAAAAEDQKFYNMCASAGNKEAIDKCVESLKNDGIMLSESRAILERGFISWLDEEVNKEVKIRMDSRRFLDELLMDVVNKREAEYAEAIWREVYEDDPLKIINDDGLAPPPTPGTSYMEDETDEEIAASDYLNELTDGV